MYLFCKVLHFWVRETKILKILNLKKKSKILKKKNQNSLILTLKMLFYELVLGDAI